MRFETVFKNIVDEYGSEPSFRVVVKLDSVFWRLRVWLKVELVDWLLVLHVFETCSCYFDSLLILRLFNDALQLVRV